MTPYNHKKIEKKWQKAWAARKQHQTKDSVKGKKNEMLLVEFPYPSGNLHVGHWYAFAMPDIYARFRRALGKNVVYPIGFDAFGLPAENAAIKRGLNPRKWTLANMAYMKKQLASMGASFDWSRQVATTDPAYYKWTQWQFLQFYKNGLAYQKELPANWCPKDKTVLANEQVVGGMCERCGTQVEQRSMLQWNLRITNYADRLISDLEPLDWPQQIKDSQRNWIGKSEGAEILFPLIFDKSAGKKKFVLLHGFKGAPIDYHWLKSELMNLGHEVVVPILPNAANPVEKEWVDAVLSATTYTENTVLFGYSLGAVAAMKALEKIDVKIAGLVLAGGFVDPEFKDARRNFEKKFAWQFDANTIRAQAGYIHILHDTTDTAISDAQAKRLGETLGAPVTYVQAQEPHFCGDKELVLLNYLVPSLKVFTTRPDTLYGATYMVLAPEHPWVTLALTHKGLLKNESDVRDYIKVTQSKSDIERQENKEKTGVELEGVEAINPATGEKIPVFIADYVLSNYGTGAIMAVPAHDERDFEFAKKFGLPVKQVIMPDQLDHKNPPRPDKQNTERETVHVILRDPKKKAVLVEFLKDKKWEGLNPRNFIIGGIEQGESEQTAAEREIREETGYTNFKYVKTIPLVIQAKFFAAHKDVNRNIRVTGLVYDLVDDEQVAITEDEHFTKESHEIRWLPYAEVAETLTIQDDKLLWRYYQSGGFAYTDGGLLIHSGEFSGQPIAEAKRSMTDKFGVAKTTYKLRDWGVSRQRYWGVPIPIIHCAACGPVAVPDKDLPVKLPEIKDYLPTGDGKSPLAKVSKWVNVKCPQCKGKAQRETDTLDTFVDSSWYFLRYTDPKNKKSFADIKKQQHWMPVDLYSGGAEHTTMHLLYSRFWHKALYDLKLVKEKEPYARRMNRGLILGPDGAKMSKSKGNVIDPDEVVEKLGSDTVRLYLAFIGPYNEPGSYPWNPDSIAGVRRFLERVWRLRDKASLKTADGDTDRVLHQTIKKVGEDCQDMKFNTAIAQMMIFVNAAEKSGVTQKQYATFLQLLAPFAPHITEELWSALKQKGSIHLMPWPKHNPKLLVADTATFVIQVNGKVRGQMSLGASATEAEVRAAAEAHDSVKPYLAGGIVKVIFVPGKLISFVVRT